MPTSADVFARALFMRPTRAAGVRLLPYSLYHDYVLRDLGSPYYHGGSASVGDTVTALVVCRLRCRDRLRPVEHVHWRGWRRVLWLWRVMSHGPERVQRDLAAHIDAYRVVPEIYVAKETGAASISGAPPHWHTAVVLASEVAGCTWPAVWDLPYCTAAGMKAILNERVPFGPIIRGDQHIKAEGAAHAKH